ncbi:IclR family transcriptional regulator [Xinfangfangia sp. D13-10-4-6]|uniref:IclR family transcriptional regulator n=1 Tax=Pseudogemmobacter hezensis TaxID=2737662 RepID=UPI001557883C|nr:IclR family transcriptional regulator [Pseudogemmobacter hezensis]NPD14708.1 IclR family transcriptional regulator [Pseudogemmobacter hezensis]
MAEQQTAEHLSEEGEGSAAADRYRAPALDKGLDILEVLADQARGLTRSEIVRELGLSPSQIYRMLERLVSRGYVSRDEGGDRYALTMKLFQLSTRHPPLRRLVAQAQPLMDEFARISRQSCHLVVPDRGLGHIIAQASPTGHWEFRARIGGLLDLFTTGSGLTLLAFQHPDRVIETLGTWGVADARARLDPVAPQLQELRRLGSRTEPSGHLVGVTDISVPVLSPRGEAIAALTCAFIEHPAESGTESRADVLAALQAVARQL